MRSKLGPTSGSNKHWRMSSATGSSSSCSEPSKTSRRVVEVITLSSSESEAEDLEIIAARLRKAKGTRKYTETTRRIVQSNRSKNLDDDSSKRECMCSRPRVPFTKLGSIKINCKIILTNSKKLMLSVSSSMVFSVLSMRVSTLFDNLTIQLPQQDESQQELCL